MIDEYPVSETEVSAFQDNYTLEEVTDPVSPVT